MSEGDDTTGRQAKAPSRSVQNSAYETLRELILSMKLRPGELVSERWLEEQLGASRSPIRAALAQLESEGLIYKFRRQSRVAPIDIAETEEACAFREIIELAGIEQACATAPQNALEEIEDILAGSSRDVENSEWLAVAWDFHRSIIALSQNRFLENALSDVTTRLVRARWLTMEDQDARADAWNDHHAIATLLRHRDVKGAQRIMKQHLRATHDRLISRLRETSATDGTRTVATVVDHPRRRSGNR